MTHNAFAVKAQIYFCLGLVAFWLTHIIYCFYTDSYGLLVAGAVLFPIGILHGVWITVAGFCNMLLWFISLLIASVSNFIGMF